jgi:predicted AlkP superfamily pyrophosphatase or phosphodiesterase
MHRTAVLLVVGLTQDLLGEHSPNLNALAKRGGLRSLNTITPAVTCSAQATLMTGTLPSEHGIVANGWYFRDLSEVWLWRQSERLVSGEKIWDAAKKRDPSFTCAKMFWWYNMYSSADYAVTPRPMYPADGRKLPDVWTNPKDLRDQLQGELGTFPLFSFWGPNANIESTKWIADSAVSVFDSRNPTLTMVYLPHLDYCLQKFGPDHAEIKKEVAAVDAICGELIEHFEAKDTRVMVVSEYGITPVKDAVHINRELRKAGMIAYREELGREMIDPGNSEAFAVSDHQIAHVYVKRPERIGEVKALLEELDGVETVLDEQGKRDAGLAHPRSGELVAISKADRWFSYYFWLDDDRAPDYARTVDIHRKPGYDPAELFVNPKIAVPMATIGWKLLKKKLGFRYMMDVIGLNASIVRGSHGRVTDRPEAGPLVISSQAGLLPDGSIDAVDFKGLVLDHLFND